VVAVGICDDGKAGEEIPVSKYRSSLHLAATLENFLAITGAAEIS
jgi:hypothetical protein